MAGSMRLSVLAFVVLACLAAPAQAGARVVYKDVSDVPDLDYVDGQAIVRTASGKKWVALLAEGQGRVYFADMATGHSIWEDPRTVPLTEDEKSGLSPDRLLELEANHTRLAMRALGHKTNHGAIMLTAMVPVAVLAAAVVARIWYLQAYHPEALFPTKERKYRPKRSAKLKAQKARGKMNQDGKGGRSANT